MAVPATWPCLSVTRACCALVPARRSYPFPDLHSTAELMRAVKGGVRPTRPETAPPGWADLVELCWDDDPARRPEIARVHDILHAIPVDRLPSDDT